MTPFLDAFETNSTTTENGMVAHSSTLDANLDFFFKLPNLRRAAEIQIKNEFDKAYANNPELAIRTMLYVRDVREGQGERRSFRVLLKHLATKDPEAAVSVANRVAELGRFDDLLSLMDTPVANTAMGIWASAVNAGNNLAAKWMPREGKQYSKYATQFRQFLEMSPRQYRQYVVYHTDVVETFMSSKRWAEIVYEHVPSQAMRRYSRAFRRQDSERFETFLTAAVKGETKINAGAVYPHELLTPLINSRPSQQERDRIVAQWNSLPDYVGEHKFFPMIDVSGSMLGEPMNVAVSLGIYLSERNKSAFKDAFLTFSGSPKFERLTGLTLEEKVKTTLKADWGMNTNLERAFTVMLDQAVKNNVSPEDMPEYLLILSDMQFDQATYRQATAFDMIAQQYADAGYVMPKIVFWNLRATLSSFPVQKHTSGAALVSGFSPSLMKSLLSGEMTPEKQMLAILSKPRYDF